MGNFLDAPGAPGGGPTWASSAKDTVGTSLGPSRLWFTLGYGILNEIFYPHVDIPQTRDFGFIVADGKGFWVEVKRENSYTVRGPEPGIPAFTIEHTHKRFHLLLRVTPDPYRDTLLIDARLTGEGLSLYALLAPHLGDGGSDNHAWNGRHATHTALYAQREGYALALLASDEDGNDAILRGSCGYVGTSDGWQDFNRNGAMRWSYPSAGPGNVALMAELPAHVRLALGFGSTPIGAGTHAHASLVGPFDQAWSSQIEAWQSWHQAARARSEWIDTLDDAVQAEVDISAMVLKVHEDKVFHGATVASLSTPWGQSTSNSGGYHLVWTRDLVETAMGLLAVGSHDDARAILKYVVSTQTPDGHWYQNQWLRGEPFWRGIQLDEAGFPILLASALAERDGLDGCEVAEMVRLAASYIAREGPITQQDRWEEDAGLNPFTLAVCISALVCAAPFLEAKASAYALELADMWNAQVEAWTFVRGGDLAKRFSVTGYYVRTTPPAALDLRSAVRGTVPIKNRPAGSDSASAVQMVGLEFLQLVRMGLRSPDDPHIQQTVKVADGLLKVETPSGAAWHRYPGDGYGEHADGAPFDGTGIGRAWPLLAGERGHYACAAGESIAPYVSAMMAMSSTGGMIPEQVWDTDPIPERGLYPGRPSGSANPLVWAHSEFIKLCASGVLGHAFDRPNAVWERYGGRIPDSPRRSWRFQHPRSTLTAGKQLRLEVKAPARIRYTTDDWKTFTDCDTVDTGLGIYIADLPTSRLKASARAIFTFYWIDTNNWEGRNFEVVVA
ncbi:MAG: glycoside hydrolase family 15 protein [Vulcanimicrobiaceae bacterium]